MLKTQDHPSKIICTSKKKKKKNLEKPRQTVLIFGANYKLWNEIPGRMKDVFRRKLIYD